MSLVDILPGVGWILWGPQLETSALSQKTMLNYGANAELTSKSMGHFKVRAKVYPTLRLYYFSMAGLLSETEFS